MTTKIGQLYITMGSMLKYLQSNVVNILKFILLRKCSPEFTHTLSITAHDIIGDDVIEDLTRLCTTFEGIEKLILLAASLHHKFLQSPHLAQAIFDDYYNYYLAKMGTSSAQGDTKKVINSYCVTFCNCSPINGIMPC